MSFCIECGAELPRGAKFCMSCGTGVWTGDQPEIKPPVAAIIEKQQGQSSPSYPFAGEKPVASSPPDPFTQKPKASTSPPDPFTQKPKASTSPPDPFTQKPKASTSPPDPFAQKQQAASLLKRVKGIIFNPAEEWQLIEGETPNVKRIIAGYVLILLLIPALSVFIGIGLIGQSFGEYHFTSLPAGAIQGFIQLLAGLVSIRITAALVTILAPGFDSLKDYGRSVQLVAYSMTPYWVLGILYILPSLAFLKSLAMIAGGIYSIYLMYTGMPVLLKTPSAKTPAFLVLLIVIQFAIMFCLFWVLGLLAPLFLANRLF